MTRSTQGQNKALLMVKLKKVGDKQASVNPHAIARVRIFQVVFVLLGLNVKIQNVLSSKHVPDG